MKWSLVTGADFRRSMDWAKAQPQNPITEALKAHRIMPRIICISDTHGLHDQVKVPNGDILICAGDVTDDPGQASLRMFLKWFNNHPHPIKILIAGNHDWAFEKWPKQARDMVSEYAPNVKYLEDESFESDGIKFHGSPVSPRFYDWAFNRDRGPDIQRHWDMIPDDTQVLITHGPPMGILDETTHGKGGHFGCSNLDSTIRERLKNLKLHVFGHFHGPGGKVEMRDGVMYVNASVVNEKYRVVNQPVIINV